MRKVSEEEVMDAHVRATTYWTSTKAQSTDLHLAHVDEYIQCTADERGISYESARKHIFNVECRSKQEVAGKSPKLWKHPTLFSDPADYSTIILMTRLCETKALQPALSQPGINNAKK